MRDMEELDKVLSHKSKSAATPAPRFDRKTAARPIVQAITSAVAANRHRWQERS